MMQSVLGNSSKVLVDQKGGASLLYLPLDKLIQQAAAPAPRRRAGRATPAPRPPRTPPPRRAGGLARSARSRDALRNREGRWR